MNLPDNFVFSQSSLQDYVDCPRRFQLRYIDRLRYPTVDAQPVLLYEERTKQGARFHKIVQQYFAGVPVDLLEQALLDDETLSTWWGSFYHQWQDNTFDFKQHYVENTLQTTIEKYHLIAKYDYIGIEQDGSVVVFDWKTYRQIPKRSTLYKRMQTKVYLYVLSQAGAYLSNSPSISAEDLIMTYWFVGDKSETISFDYSHQQMQDDENELIELIHEIESQNDFALTDDTRKCQFCSYRSLCNRGDKAGEMEGMMVDEVDDDDTFSIDFDQIAEVEF